MPPTSRLQAPAEGAHGRTHALTNAPRESSPLARGSREEGISQEQPAMRALARVQPTALATPEKHPVLLYLARLSAGSRPAMKGALEEFCRGNFLTYPWAQVRYLHVAAFRSRLQETGQAPATINRKLCAVRGVLKELWRMGKMSAEEYQRAAATEGVRGERAPAGRALTHEELTDLFRTCASDTPGGKRDAAMLALLYGCGLRRSELCALEPRSYDKGTGALRVLGKGNKERIVYVKSGARAALHAWLDARGSVEGKMFVPVNRGSTVAGPSMTPAAVFDALKRLADRAGIARFSPHDLRRTFVGDLLDAGADLATVQKMAGHESPNTTARYDRRGERAKEKAALLLHVPFHG
jgi:site-specific recombinase XerD